MQKKLYWQLESSLDLSIIVSGLPECQMEIESYFYSLSDQEKLNIEFTMTPIYLTDSEYAALEEA